MAAVPRALTVEGVMKAIVQERYGSPDALRYADVEKPVPGPNEVLVQVRAAALNAYDWHMMRGDPYVARLSLGLTKPKARIRGRDFAGVVEAVGAQVKEVKPGDEVFGDSGSADGALAEYLTVGSQWLQAKPASLTFEEAAAIPLAGLTALQGLQGVRAGQHVLINGASGGVGTFAVQIAKALGAKVTAVCSTRNVELIRSLGVDGIVDYTKEDFTNQRYDLIFDLVGNRSLKDLRAALSADGTLVLSGGGVYTGGSVFGPMGLIIKGHLASRFGKERLVILSTRRSMEDLAMLADLAASGKVKPIIDRSYPLTDAPQAIRYLETEHARAKVVVSI